ncbi:hypothetical protein F5883DRAFT_609259 [Diaporthe sp. PMI_573]|nr:hypothetical protein F5883DRAFT_609259 [Diaporthaceae sp. PMI_573]
MTPEQLDVYALRFRIEEIGQKIHAGDPPPSTNSKRSSSPAPEYDTSGRRINTRQHRYRQCLEQERQALVGTALNTIPGYQRPRDLHSFKQPLSIEKVYIPVKDFPSINFIGQILGPRGQSLADLNNQSGAHIAIRGKGSVKEGRAGHFRGHRNTSTATDNDQQGPLHCLIRADTQEKVSHAKILINEVIEAAACAPEDQTQRKRDQLRQLAVMNGTFRDDECRACENCGQTGHRHYFCTMPTRFVAHVTCHSCKNTGHVARDCPQKSMGPAKLPPWRKDRLARRPETTGPDAEFEQLMLEIGN